MIALILLTLFVILPTLEIWVIVKVAMEFGAFPTVLATIFTAILGSIIIRMQGFAAINELRADLQNGTSPAGPIIHGAFLLFAAPLLMLPGFITDGIGFLLLVPPIRVFLGRAILKWVKKQTDAGHIKIL